MLFGAQKKGKTNFDNILANNDLDEDKNSHNEDSLQDQKQLR
jgi:hypothetical protein